VNIYQAKKEISFLENELEYFKNEREQLSTLVSVKSSRFDSIRVDGGIKEDKLLEYMRQLEESGIDNKIQFISNRINMLENYIEKELEILEQYEPLAKRIIELRDKYNMKWEDVANSVNYSRRQCIRIYNKVKNRVNMALK